MKRWTICLASPLALALTACGSGNSSQSDTAPPEVVASAEASGTVVEAATSPSPETTATDAAAATTTTTAASDLNAYVGKYPFDEVGGVTWEKHPLVVAGVRKTVTDAAVRRAIETVTGPSAPIGRYQGKVGAWLCQQHNCGDHQWTVLVDPKNGATDVCYHNAEQSAETSRWFLASGKEESREGDCSVV